MATFSADIVVTGASSVYFSGSFSGGDYGRVGPRYVLLVILGVGNYEIISNEESDGTAPVTFTWDTVVNGLSPGTYYEWTAKVGFMMDNGVINYNNGYLDGGYFTTNAESIDVEPWSWSASTQRSNFLKMLNGQLPVDYAYAAVWNDIVDKIDEVLTATGLSWQSDYASKASTKVSSRARLSAVRYNSAKHNIERLASTGLSFVSSGDRMYGKHFAALTDAINAAIG